MHSWDKQRHLRNKMYIKMAEYHTLLQFQQQSSSEYPMLEDWQALHHHATTAPNCHCQHIHKQASCSASGNVMDGLGSEKDVSILIFIKTFNYRTKWIIRPTFGDLLHNTQLGLPSSYVLLFQWLQLPPWTPSVPALYKQNKYQMNLHPGIF